MNRNHGGNSLLRSALMASVIFSLPLFFSGFVLSGPVILLLIGLGALAGAVLEVLFSGTALNLGAALIVGALSAVSGALLQALVTIYLLLGGSNPVGQKLAGTWMWLVRGPLSSVAPGMEQTLRPDLAWLMSNELHAQAIVYLALFSAAAALLPAMGGAAVGALLMGGEKSSSRNPSPRPGA